MGTMLKLVISFFRPETKSREQTTSLLSLPRELRDEIYRYCFVSSKPLLPNFYPPRTLHVALLRTCKQIHEEAAEILYGENEFEIGLNLYVWWTGETGWNPTGVLMGLHSFDAVPGARQPIATYKGTDDISNVSWGERLRALRWLTTKDKGEEGDVGEQIAWSKALLEHKRTWPAPTYHDMLKRLKIRVNLTWGIPLGHKLARQNPSGILDTFAANLSPFLEKAKVELQFRVREKGPGAFIHEDQVEALWPTLDMFKPFRMCPRMSVTGSIDESDRRYLLDHVLTRSKSS